MQNRHNADIQQSCSEDVAEKVKAVIAAYLDLPRELVVEDASLSHDLGADSLELTEIVMAFEEAFGFEIDDDAFDRLLTVGDVVEHLQRLADARN